MTAARIWVVDDDADHRDGLCDLIGTVGFDVTGFDGAGPALDVIDKTVPDMILSDLRMPGIDGIAFLDALRERQTEVPVVLLTGHGDVQQAVSAMQRGAVDFLEKPYDADHLLSVIDRTLATGRLRAENAILRQRLRDEQPELIGETTAITALRNRLAAIAPLPVEVVLQGENGTGKSLAARCLHAQSGRTGAFVTINCAALPDSGFAADLFGRVDAAGALQPGRVVAAEGGTLFLDHIDVMPLALQPVLLRLLDTRQIDPVGGHQPVPVDIRIVAAAATDLREMIAEGGFRRDLYYRLAGVDLTFPPLRQITPDIPVLFQHFLSDTAARHGFPVPEVGFEERRALIEHHWPGNAIELQQAARRRVLGLADPMQSKRSGPRGTLKDRVTQFEAMEIARVLDQCRGNTARAAAQLGIPRRTLAAKISRTGIKP